MRGKRQKEQPVGFNPAEIFTALALLEKERGIPQDFMLEKITQAMIAAYKKDHPGVDNVEVDADTERRTLRMFIIKTVVAEEDYLDPANEILLEDARKIYRRYEPGDTVDLPVDNVEFGRIAAGNGKQVIIQGLREAERGMVYDEFNSREHEILTGSPYRQRHAAHRFRRGVHGIGAADRGTDSRRGPDRGNAPESLRRQCQPLHARPANSDLPHTPRFGPPPL